MSPERRYDDGRRAGPALAKELLILRKRIDASESCGLGPATEVTGESEALASGLELAHKVAELPPLAVAAAKQTANAIAEAGREAGIMLERLAYAALAQTPESREAGAVFSARKKPKDTT